MRTSFNAALLLAASASVLAAPVANGEGLISITRGDASQEVEDYNCIFSKVDDSKEFANASQIIASFPKCATVTGILDNAAFRGAHFTATEECAAQVNTIAEVEIMNKAATVQTYAIETLTDSPWGLQRISSSQTVSGSASSQSYTYTADSVLGQGVDVYIIDTGIRTTHAVWTANGNRATFGYTAVKNADGTDDTTDGDGHGTHVAGTATGFIFGVAQNANVIACKALDDSGSGSSAAIMDCLQYVVNQHNAKKGKSGFVGSVINMSLGLSQRLQSLEEAITSTAAQGIHIAVAGGNDATDACTESPSGLGGGTGGGDTTIISVGAMDITNAIASFSNTGKCIDLYAPGVQVLSSWNTSDNAINFLSGTSMATPHVTGMLAYLAAENPSAYGQNPQALKDQLIKIARSNLVTGNTDGGANLLLSNGVDSSTSKAKRLMKNWVVPGQDFEVVSNNSPLRF